MNVLLAITAAEVFCPIGLNSLQAATSVMTGISRVEETSMMDERFMPISMGLVPEDVLEPLKDEIQQQPYMTAHCARLIRLLSPCLQNLARAGLPLELMPMFLAGPRHPVREYQSPHPKLLSMREDFFSHLETQSEVQFGAGDSRLFPCGRTGLFDALFEANTWIASGAFEHVIVGGVDTLFDPMVIARYQSENRIMKEGGMDGFTPGEGAGLIVVSRPDQVRHEGHSPIAYIRGLGKGEEEGHRYSEKPYRGEGLSLAFSELFDETSEDSEPVATVFAGFNGENFNAKEWGVAYLRNQEHFTDPYHIEHPVEYFGDARAAVAPIMTAIGAYGLSKNMWEEPMLIWSSSDEAERGAALISRKGS